MGSVVSRRVGVRSAILLLSLFLTACVTVYSGPLPQPTQPQAVAPPQAGPAPQPPPQAPSEEDRLTVAEAIQLCKAVQAAEELPIGCSATYVEGKPAMFVSFGSMKDVEQYWEEMTEVVTGPFCAATNAGNREAYLFVGLVDIFVGLVDTEVGKLFSCETSEWSDWFSFADDSF